jgi:hypothetical protein
VSVKQQSGNSVENKEVAGSTNYTREFRDQVIEVYNSGVYGAPQAHNIAAIAA